MRRARCVARLYRLHDHFFVTERGHTHTNSTVGRQHTHARHDVNLQELGLQRLLPTLFNKNLSQRHTLYNHMNAPARCEDPLIAQSHERMDGEQVSSIIRISIKRLHDVVQTMKALCSNQHVLGCSTS